MNIKSKFKKGDISLIIVVLVSGIILSLLIPLSQKVSVEANISRENLMSQQAIQVAKVGLEDWIDNFYSGNIDISTTSTTQNWPNINTSTSIVDGDWIRLDSSPNIQYKVRYEQVAGVPGQVRLISTGRVRMGSKTIERTLEDTRSTL